MTSPDLFFLYCWGKRGGKKKKCEAVTRLFDVMHYGEAAHVGLLRFMGVCLFRLRAFHLMAF